MPYAVTLDTLQTLEEKLGKDDARKVAEAIELGLEIIDKKAEAVALQKKLELRDELTKELITKAEFYGENKALRQEMQTLRQEMQTLRQEMLRIEAQLDRKFTLMFSVLLFTIILLNQNALEFIARLLGLLK